MRFLKTLLIAGVVGAGLALAHAGPADAASWVPGHYLPDGAFVPGHWVGGPGVWVGGHYGPAGYWVPGHWAVGEHWVHGYYGPYGGWHPGHWAWN